MTAWISDARRTCTDHSVKHRRIQQGGAGEAPRDDAHHHPDKLVCGACCQACMRLFTRLLRLIPCKKGPSIASRGAWQLDGEWAQAPTDEQKHLVQVMDFFDPHFHIWDLSEGTLSGHDASILFAPGGDPVYTVGRYESEFKSLPQGLVHTGGVRLPCSRHGNSCSAPARAPQHARIDTHCCCRVPSHAPGQSVKRAFLGQTHVTRGTWGEKTQQNCHCLHTLQVYFLVHTGDLRTAEHVPARRLVCRWQIYSCTLVQPVGCIVAVSSHLLTWY